MLSLDTGCLRAILTKNQIGVMSGNSNQAASTGDAHPSPDQKIAECTTRNDLRSIGYAGDAAVVAINALSWRTARPARYKAPPDWNIRNLVAFLFSNFMMTPTMTLVS